MTTPLNWLSALRVYLLSVTVGDLAWEAAHLPLYTLWRTGTTREKLFAVIHCTLGDILIAVASLTFGLVLAGHRNWPGQRFGAVAALTMALGLGYTGFSEWLNVVVRQSWAYSALMPVVPVLGFGVGASPLLQWVIVPALAFGLARRAAHGRQKS